jgi:hypothetical protein
VLFFVSGKWFNCNDCWKDFPALFDLLKPQVIPNVERPNTVSQRRHLTMEKVFSCWLTGAKLLAIKMWLFITQESTMEKSFIRIGTMR